MRDGWEKENLVVVMVAVAGNDEVWMAGDATQGCLVCSKGSQTKEQNVGRS